MEAVLLVIHLIVAIGIIVTILVQPSEAGGFMGNTGAMSNLMVQRRSGDVLTRATTILAGIFFLTSLLLAISASSRPVQKGILELDTGEAKPAVTAPAKVDTSPDVPAVGQEDAAPQQDAPKMDAPKEEPAAMTPAEKPAEPVKAETTKKPVKKK